MPRSTTSPPDSRERMLQALIAEISRVFRGMSSCSADVPFQKHQLSRGQCGVLFLLSEHHHLSVKELAALLKVTSGAITQFADVLVEKELVQREEDAADRRVQRIALTKAAARHFMTFRQEYFETVSPMFRKLDIMHVRQLILLHRAHRHRIRRR